ncbi:hypothetical protein ACFVTC_21075 [Streptomyces sp. NPDC057950]|uniref:HflX-like GTP-binding protein n=1 Tax=Streptomyces sp. NPDC057950 TaxID=3346288 RepID=UPI0036E6FABC
MRDGLPLFRGRATPADARPGQAPARSGTLPGHTASWDAILATLLSHGKVREVAQACDQADADTVVFVPTLTERQQRTLTTMLGRPAVSLSDILAADRPLL